VAEPGPGRLTGSTRDAVPFGGVAAGFSVFPRGTVSRMGGSRAPNPLALALGGPAAEHIETVQERCAFR